MTGANLTSGRLLDPSLLMQFSNLELLARTVVDGVLGGLHRSPRFGFSQDFAEYRAYNEGDDPRHIDWNVYARTDRMYVKRFVGDTRTSVLQLLDSSASMRFSSGALSKLDYARYLSATLAMIASRQLDSPGLVVFDDAPSHWLAPSSRPGSVMHILSVLENLVAAEGTDLPAAIERAQELAVRRGVLIVISDFYCDPRKLGRALLPFSAGGHDIVLMHIADPKEIEPDYRQTSRLKNPETSTDMLVSAEYLQKDYPERFRRHCQQLQHQAAQIRADYCLVDTSEPLDATLRAYLEFREHARG